MPLFDSHLWLYDFVAADTDGMVHQIMETVLTRKTEFQLVNVLSTPRFGKILTLDGRVQSLEMDEFVYHESLCHPALVCCPEPKKALVIGGGEGACLREILRHKTITDAVMVDIDGELIGICKEHLPTYHQGAFDHPKTRLYFQDAAKFVRETTEKFDVVIVDLSEPSPGTPAYYLFTTEFYTDLSKILAPNAVVAFQSDAAAIHAPSLWTTTVNTIRTAFPHVRPYVTTIPGFGSEWGFALASHAPIPELNVAQVNAVLEKRLDPSSLRFYDGETHQRLFSLPKYMRTLLDNESRVFRLDSPPVVEW